MVLQIEAPEIIRLVEELSRQTGESAESAIAAALRERLERLRVSEEEAKRRAEVYALVHELAGYSKEAPHMDTDRGELLYGEDGLPK